MGKSGVPVGARVRLVAACCLVSMQPSDSCSSAHVKRTQKAEVEGVEPEPPGGLPVSSLPSVSKVMPLSKKIIEDVVWVAKNPLATLADMAETIVVFLPGSGAIDVFETVSGRSAFPPFETLSPLDRSLAAVGIVIGSRLVLRRAFDVGVEASYPLREALSSDLMSSTWKRLSFRATGDVAVQTNKATRQINMKARFPSTFAFHLTPPSLP